MKCPICIEPDLVMTERQGIEIDYCPKCRGVWLDRGELDKIIERSVSGSIAAAGGASAPPSAPPYRPSEDDSDDERGGFRRPRRKESWISSLFD